MTTNTDDGSVDKDPSQLIPPKVNAGLRINGYSGEDLLHAGPGVCLLLTAGGVLSLSGSFVLASVLAGVGSVLAVAGYWVSATAHDHTTGADRVRGAINHLIKQRSHPKSHEEATAVHGVKRIHSDGSAETEDGRVVVLARLHGRNTDLQDNNESRIMIGELRSALNDDAPHADFSIFSTAVPFNASEITDDYREQWLSDRFTGSEWTSVRTLLSDIVDWEEQQEEIWESREWQHYLVVSVSAADVDLPDLAVSSDRSRIEEIRVALGGDYDTVDNKHWQARRRRMRSEAKQRLDGLKGAFQTIEGVNAETIGPAEHALLLARYWAGTDHSFDANQVTEEVNVSVWPYPTSEDVPRPEAVEADKSVDQTAVADVTRVSAAADGGTESISQTVAGTTEAHDDPEDTLADEEAAGASFLARIREGLFAPGTDDTTSISEDTVEHSDPIQDALAPSMYDDQDGTDGGYVVTGDQYCRTYWIADWPSEPREQFLEGLYTLRGVDVDVHLRVRAKDKEQTLAEVKNTVGEIDADVLDRREEADDVESILIEDDLDAHVKLLKLLHQTDVKPWGLSGYVTVRVGTRRALDDVQALIDEGLVEDSQLSLDVAKQHALTDACKTVTDVLERSPARLTPIADAQRQGELFEACSPNGQDAYAASSFRSRYRTTASGTIAAVFPAATTYIRQDSGIEHGRSVTNGSVIRNDPFDPGPGHVLTTGTSGSGKTSDALSTSIRWYLRAPDERTLIYTDTQTDFVAPTEILNGTQITLDGDTTINPCRMIPTSQEALKTTGLDPFEMKYTQVLGLLLPIVAVTPKRRDQFRPLLKDGIRGAMADAGIDPNDPLTHTPENSPTVADIRRKVREIGENPTDFARSELAAREIENNAGALLRRMSGFSEDGEYGFLTGQSEVTIDPGGVTYLDLQQLEGQGSAADASTMLNMALGQVYETVKRAEQTMFVIDEAHYLLESKDMLQWLSQASRHWRHNNAGLWFLTQELEDFVKDDDDEKESYKDVIRQQTNTVKLFSSKEIPSAAIDKFDLNDRQIEYITKKATRGNKGQGYANCLIDFNEVEGWVRSHVKLSPVEELITTYEPDEHGHFEEYLERNRR